MEKKPLGPSLVVPDGAQSFRLGMARVIELGGVLDAQHHRVRLHPFDRGLLMRFEKNLQCRPFVVEEAVGRFGFRPVSPAGLGDRGLRPGKEVSRQNPAPGGKPGVSQIHAPELLLRPVGEGRTQRRRLRDLSLPEPLPEVADKRIGQDRLDRRPQTLSPQPRRRADLHKVRRPVARPGKPLPVDEGLDQHRSVSVMTLPVAGQTAKHPPQKMRGQMGNPQMRQDQKPAVVHHLAEVLLPCLGLPADPQVPDRDLPGRRREGRSPHISKNGAPGQIPDLGAAQRSLAQVMIPRKERVPYPGRLFCRHGLKFEDPELGQGSRKRLHRLLPQGIPDLGRLPSGNGSPGGWKDDLSLLLELGKKKPGAHLLGLSVRSLSPEELTHSSRQGASGDGLRRLSPNRFEDRVVKSLAEDFHADQGTRKIFLCPQSTYGARSGIQAGLLPPPDPVVRRPRKEKTPPPPKEPRLPKETPAPPPVRIVLPESYHVDPALLEKDEVLDEQDLQTIARETERFCQDFAPAFRKAETRRYSHLYTLGLLSDLGRKSIEPIALFLEGSHGVRNLQRFVSDYLVDDALLKTLYQRKALLLLSPRTSKTPAMWTLDPSEFPKKGSESVGVAPQYCGHLGKVANCQSGVFLGLVTDRGHAFLDARLYLPEVWFEADHAQRRKKTGVPETETFRTKNQIALELLKKAHESGPLAVSWVGVDAGLGSDRSFLDDIPSGLTYFASVRSNIRVLPDRPVWDTPEGSGRGRKPAPRLSRTPVTVEELARQASWTEVIRPSASFGVERVFVSRLRVFLVPKEPLDPPSSVWLFLFRSEAQNEQGKTKYVLCNAPEDCPLETMVQVSILRWSIERALLEGKSFLGMGHYENRSWTGWHRHMAHVFLAHLFLQSLRIDFKKSPSDPSPGPSSGGRCPLPNGLPASLRP